MGGAISDGPRQPDRGRHDCRQRPGLLVVTGTTTLTDANNNVALLAADTDGTIDYRDLNDLDVQSVTVLAATIRRPANQRRRRAARRSAAIS